MATTNDRAVLNAIFNPEFPTAADDDGVVSRKDIQDQDDGLNVDSSILERVKVMEKQAVIAAEGGHLNQALELFEKAINEIPHKASLFNNRAQVYQLMNKTDEALKDLDQAILLSQGKGLVACNAFTQRAVLHIKLNGMDPENEKARSDLKSGADLGSDFCKKLLVKLNPYSALCNSMLKDMMSQYKQ